MSKNIWCMDGFQFGKNMTDVSLVIACGYTSQRELCKGKEIVAFDIDSKKILSAKKIDQSAHYVVCDALFMPFKNRVFNDIVCTDVLEHIVNYEAVLNSILELKPKFIYLRFPTEAREKLLTRFSRVYKSEHWGKIHVRLVDVRSVVQTLLDHGYIVDIDLTSARSTLQRIFLQKTLEILRIPYKIPDVGLVEFPTENLVYKFIVQASTIMGTFGIVSRLIWKFFRVQTLHDNYIISAVYGC